MKFYDREKEINLIKKLSKGKGTRVLIVRGLRRIGKTRTVLEALKNKKYVYLFIPKGKSVNLFLEEISEDLNIPKFTRIMDFFRYIFEKYKIVFLDEFQNFYYMDKSIYSDIQKLIDEYRFNSKNLFLIITGSSYSLIKKIFYDYSKSMYGRKDFEIILEELKFKFVYQILKDLGFKNIEDIIKVWSIFGGIPKFYEMIETLQIKRFSELVEILFGSYKSFYEEGKTILISEFGGEYKIYYTILEGISLGKTKLSELSSLFENDVIRTNRYLKLLLEDYNLIKKEQALFGKDSFYMIKNNFLRFWFKYYKRYEHLLEISPKLIFKIFDMKFNQDLGFYFEKLCKEVLIDIIKPHNIGKQFGKCKKGTYEIDIVSYNDKLLIFGECKWKDKVNPRQICKELVEKINYVNIPNNLKNNKVELWIFAKSFKEKIDMFENYEVKCFDLKDIENIVK